MKEIEPLITIKQLSGRIPFGVTRIRSFMEEGLPSMKIGGKRLFYYKDVLYWLEEYAKKKANNNLES